MTLSNDMLSEKYIIHSNMQHTVAATTTINPYIAWNVRIERRDDEIVFRRHARFVALQLQQKKSIPPTIFFYGICNINTFPATDTYMHMHVQTEKKWKSRPNLHIVPLIVTHASDSIYY